MLVIPSCTNWYPWVCSLLPPILTEQVASCSPQPLTTLPIALKPDQLNGQGTPYPATPGVNEIMQPFEEMPATSPRARTMWLASWSGRSRVWISWLAGGGVPNTPGVIEIRAPDEP